RCGRVVALYAVGSANATCERMSRSRVRRLHHVPTTTAAGMWPERPCSAYLVATKWDRCERLTAVTCDHLQRAVRGRYRLLMSAHVMPTIQTACPAARRARSGPLRKCRGRAGM